MFIDEQTQNKIHADLDRSVSHATMRRQDLIPAFLDVIKDTPEYVQYMLANIPPAHAQEDDNAEWWDSDESMFVMEELFELLEQYAPDGYYFGAHPGDGSDYGFWKSEED